MWPSVLSQGRPVPLQVPSISRMQRSPQARNRLRPLARLIPPGSPHRSMSVSATRPVRHNVPSQLSIVARPHEDGLIRCWRADSLCLRVARSPELPHVVKLFCPFECVRLIQDLASMRNVDSRIHSLRFDSCVFLFYSFSTVTFATQSAGRRHSVGLSAHYSVAAAWRNVMVPSAKLRRQFHATLCTDIRVFDRPRFGVGGCPTAQYAFRKDHR